MQTAEYLTTVIQELQEMIPQIAETDAEQLVHSISVANKVFVAGAGRSGLMGKAFVMRMMHMDIDAYIIGETVTANLEKDDLLIIGSGSGETETLIAIANKAKRLGGKVAVITTKPDSTLGQMADLTIQLPGVAKHQTADTQQTIQPMGSLFEQTLLLFYDAVILRYMELNHLDSAKMYGKHANLE